MCCWLDREICIKSSEKSTPLGTIIFNLSKVGGVNSMEEKQYLSPAVQVLELYSEGAVCTASGVDMNPEEGKMF